MVLKHSHDPLTGPTGPDTKTTAAPGQTSLSPRHLRKIVAALCFVFAAVIATSVFANTTDRGAPPRAMLVVDGSNSMWGQVDGTAKITIAQSVVRDLLHELPQELEIGLAAYGHRTHGDCHDVEIMVQPQQGNRDEITKRMDRIKPTGKTPMAEAVVQAAEALRHDQAPATVILVSDGVETCSPNVCDVVGNLEETGVDFTAHVIGFDVTEDEAHAQFACVAETTGGRYLPVTSAQDLSAALLATTTFTSTRFKPTETSLPLITTSGRLYFVASHKLRGELLNLPAHWEVLDQSGAPVMAGFMQSGGQLDLKPGTYQLTATDVESGRQESREIRVTDGGSMQITLMFP